MKRETIEANQTENIEDSETESGVVENSEADMEKWRDISLSPEE